MSGDLEKAKDAPAVDVSSVGNDSASDDEPRARLHAKTFLAVFAIGLIYFAQIFALVGGGSVSSHYVVSCNIPDTS